jgi:hypothetical protein
MKILRLLLFSACNRDCEGCCNKDWDLKALPAITDFTDYDQILLTGGEPMLSPRRIWEAIGTIRKQNRTAKIYLYTALVRAELFDLLNDSHGLDGVTLTLHEQNDVTPELLAFLFLAPREKSLRLNVFEGVSLPSDVKAFGQRVERDVLDGWKVKLDMIWIKNCPLPENETFGRIIR